MFKRYSRALWAALLHAAVLMSAHGVAVHADEILREIMTLVRDELLIGGFDKIVEAVLP